MRSVGIVCEYDPFHNGHKHQIDTVREKYPDATVVCLMSGNITQRGRLAISDKYTRAAAAVASGADLVLELPYPYSGASAEYFSAAGVCLLDSLGVDEMNFGSEGGNLDLLLEAAKVTSSEAFLEKYKNILENHTDIGSAAAYSKAYTEMTGKALPNSPNDLLGVSYLRAAIRINSKMEMTVTKREGTGFSDDTLKENEYPSATALRKLFLSGEAEKAYKYMPCGAESVYREAFSNKTFPTDSTRISNAILSFFRLVDPSSLDAIAEAGGGVGRRLCVAAKEASDFESMIATASTKRYTDARLRRAVMYCLTGVTQDDLKHAPEYTTLLAANKKGRSFLSSRDGNEVKIVTKPADAPKCRQTELSLKLDAIFTLCLPKVRSAEEFLRSSPKIFEKD